MQYKAIHKILPVLLLAQALAITGYAQPSNKPTAVTQVPTVQPIQSRPLPPAIMSAVSRLW